VSEVPGEAGIPHPGELVGDALQVVSCPLFSFLDGKGRKLSSNAFLFLSGHHILGISTKKCFLIEAVAFP